MAQLEIKHYRGNDFKRQRWIPELYDFYHRNDAASVNDKRFNYEDNLLVNSTSQHMWKNPNMKTTAGRPQKYILPLE